MQSQLDPPILIGQASKPGFNSPTPFLVYGNLDIKKTWMILC